MRQKPTGTLGTRGHVLIDRGRCIDVTIPRLLYND